jgi:hypothetical protein
MAISVHELWLFGPPAMSAGDAMRWLTERLDGKQLPGPVNALAPLPYAREAWAQREEWLLGGGQVLSTPAAIAADGDRAWPITMMHFTSARIALVQLTIPLQLPSTAQPSYGWLCRLAEQLLGGDDQFSFALINGSGDEDEEVPGEGGASSRHLAQPLPAVAAPWIYLANSWNGLPVLCDRLRSMLVPTRTLGHGVALRLSADFRTTVDEGVIAAIAAIAGRPVLCLQGRLPD